MDILNDVNKAAGTKAKDAELAKAMFEGAAQHRKKLKFPELDDLGKKYIEQTDDISYHEFIENPIAKHFFMRFVQDVQPVHGNFLLQCGRYRYSTHEKRAVAQDVCDHFVAIVTDIYSGEDIDKWIDAHEAGQKKPAPSKGSTRQKEKNGKITEAKSEVESVLNKLVKGTPPDLLDDLVNILKDDLDSYWSAFKRSKYLEQYAKARQMEEGTTVQDDYHQFRVLGVGGFGAVHAAVKRDTGLLCAIKRMDKKLIKHKNRYKSCYTEIECLKEMASPYVCGMHYSFQTKEDVCLVLDLLHGGTLSYLLHQKKKVKEKDVCFFTACITLAYQALHTKGYVYRDMKPANVLIKDNGYAVLIDFGLAAKVSTVLKGKCGTRGYWSPEMVKGDQYLYSGDWWSLGVTLVELLTGKKPFKKKFQKRKNVDDYQLVCKGGNIEDEIEEKHIEQKLGKAEAEDDDGRDSNDEESDSDDDEEKKKNKRRSSVRVIGGLDKTVESVVETEQALEHFEASIAANEKLNVFKAEDLEGGMDRCIKVMSIVNYESDTTIFEKGEFATFFILVLEGTVKNDTTVYNQGDVIGWEGLFNADYNRPETLKSGLMGGTVAICLYAEMGRAILFDEGVMMVIKKLLLDLNGGAVEMETLDVTINDFGEKEEDHPEETFIAHQKHTAKKVAATKVVDTKDLSHGKQRDLKIYLTQEVHVKKGSLSRECVKFLNGLLTRDVNKRLGCGANNFSNVKEHDWYQSGPLGELDWDKMDTQSKIAPYIPKQEVNAKDESKMKTFNTAGMKKLNKDDETKWATWDWTSADYFQDEMTAYLYEQWGMNDSKRGRVGGGGGGGGGGGCCVVS